LRFGDMTVKSSLRNGAVYGCYLRFIGYSMVFGLVGGIMFGMMAAALQGIASLLPSTVGEVVTVAVGLAAYVVFALGYSAIYWVKVRLGLWRLVVDSADLSNPAALETISSVGAPASPVGEGLADALNVGAF
jgi:hypothetical protein